MHSRALSICLGLILAPIPYASAQPAKPLTVARLWIIDATYADPKHGVTFRYPSAWQPGTQFGYHPPALEGFAQAHPTAGFGYRPGDTGETNGRPYSNSEVEGFGIAYTALAATNSKQCQKWASTLADAPHRETSVIGSRSFATYETSEDGMSQSMSGTLYATFAGNTCYLFEIYEETVSAGVVDGMRPLSAEQSSSIEKHLDTIAKSIRIAPR